MSQSKELITKNPNLDLLQIRRDYITSALTFNQCSVTYIGLMEECGPLSPRLEKHAEADSRLFASEIVVQILYNPNRYIWIWTRPTLPTKISRENFLTGQELPYVCTNRYGASALPC